MLIEMDPTSNWDICPVCIKHMYALLEEGNERK